MNEAQSPANVVAAFKGINNRLDPTRLGLVHQLQADNALCDDAGFLVRRPGQVAVTSGILDSYGTRNGRLLLVTTGGALLERFADGTTTTLTTGLTGGPFQWAELGYALFVQSASASWAIYPDRTLPWGSLCPAPPVVTYPLAEAISYPPPTGQVIASRRSQMVVGVHEPAKDRSVLYFSRPDFPHEFRLDRDFILIPGQITLLVALAQGLVMGTDRAIYVDPIDSPVQRVADYGVPPNALATDDRNVAYFWSERGLCKALPFENLTDAHLAAGLRQTVTAGILPFQGSTYAVVSQTGPLATKPMTRPYAPLAVATTHPQGIT